MNVKCTSNYTSFLRSKLNLYKLYTLYIYFGRKSKYVRILLPVIILDWNLVYCHCTLIS
jgi:hypothetical protein